MTSKEFTMWLKGFMTAAGQSEPSPANWILIKEELYKVEDNSECKCGKNQKVYLYNGTDPNWGITTTQAYSTTTTNDTSKQILND
jgi:hypothetical protein